MMNFNELRNFIIDNIEEATNMQFCTKAKGSRKTETAVFLVEKPETYTLTNNRMIIIKWREISGGKTVRRFVVETWIYAKEIKDVITIKDALTNMLDFYNRPCEITRFKKFTLSNEGGIYYDDKKQLYVDKLFFECRLV